MEHRELIRALIERLAHRKGMTEADAEDFASWAKIRILKDDEAVLRQFEGRSSWRSFLAVVLANLLRDFQNARWGRWRPSAAARRRGDAAVHLERLVVRDQVAVSQAVATLRSRGHAVTEREAFEMLDEMPARVRPRTEGEEALANIPGGEAADAGLWEASRTEEKTRGVRILDEVLASLGDEDQLVLRLRYWEGLTVAQVSRTLGVPQKPLYRRIEALLSRLKARLVERGVESEDVTRWMV